MTLTACPDLSAADWITAGDLPWDRLVSFGPSGFAAHARLRFLPDPTHDGQSENDVDLGEEHPPEAEQLRALLAVLAGHTRSPQDCYFCVWDGWGSGIYGGNAARLVDIETVATRVSPPPPEKPGWAPARPGIAPSLPCSVRPGSTVVVPNRAYFLFHGTVSELDDWGVVRLWPGRRLPSMPVPAFVWPADHAWCVADDVDPHWAGIGADASVIDQLVADPRLDVVPADPRDDQPRYE